MELVKNTPSPENEDAKPAPQVNDVAAPAQAAPAEDSAPSAEPAPKNDAEVAQAPTAANDDSGPAAEPAKDDAPKPKPIKPPKPPKQHGSGMAIFAAVVIVLALGAMFTYAYLQSQ